MRETLGCACPDSVFERLDNRHDVVLGEVVLSRRIDVGNRLLIYVLECDDPVYISRHLPYVFAIGKNERDREGFNRLRVVVGAGDPERVAAAAIHAYEGSRGGDERVHLHLVSAAVLRQL